MIILTPVDCNHCQAKRIGTIRGGEGQYRCYKCKWWTTAQQDTQGRVHYWRVDRRLLTLQELAQSA